MAERSQRHVAGRCSSFRFGNIAHRFKAKSYIRLRQFAENSCVLADVWIGTKQEATLWI